VRNVKSKLHFKKKSGCSWMQMLLLLWLRQIATVVENLSVSINPQDQGGGISNVL
jgi:hypothetical protein